MTIEGCRSCGSRKMHPVLDLGSMPLANALLGPGDLQEDEARYPLELVVCDGCGLVQITETVPPHELFTDYAYFSSYSATMVEHAAALVDDLVAARTVGPGSLAMEVASNDGYLLQHYLRHGVPVLGIDPARNVAEVAASKGIETIPRFFTPDLADELRDEGRLGDVIHVHNVLAHVPDINGFVTALRSALAPGGIVVVETPYVREMVDNLLFDTIYHEHLFYYSLTSVKSLFERNGLGIVDVEQVPIHGGSLRIVAAELGTPSHPRVERLLEQERALGIVEPGYYSAFAAKVRDLIERLSVMITQRAERGQKLAGYGAAAKGTVLMNALKVPTGSISFVVDDTPYKQGRFMPGVGIPITTRDRIYEERPDCIVVFAWNFADEIVDKEQRYLRDGGTFLIPLPEPRVVDAA